MSRRRKAGDADYIGRLNAVGSALLDEINEGKTNFKGYREIDEVFPEQVNINNADSVLLALAPRTDVKIDDSGNVTGGNAITDNQGRVNIDNVPFDPRMLSHTAPDAVNSSTDRLMQGFLNPDDVDATKDPALARAVGLGQAMRANDVAAYRDVGTPVDVTDDAAAYLAGKFTKGKGNKPLRSSSFVKVGGLGSDSRSQILVPGTRDRFTDLDKAGQGEYMDERNTALMKQWLMQGGGSIGNPSMTIVPPGMNSHMDHVQALSSSIDTVGQPKGWGYSDDPTNFSWLDAEANVHSKLNYTLQGQYMMMKMADEMRKKGQPFPARLSQSQLGDPNRKRLTDEEGTIRLATDKARNVTEAGENLLQVIQMFNKYGPQELPPPF